ncbi:ParB/RepB/Spo0J family partition protein [Streptomyces sp. NBC_01304]|uniref:ParB/RepB/Spo0J family partition protein n=1 Tax=Streptomyces sp. NBC_01304 TaxID=2903818 RepID=UPI002E117E4B|nr:ParB/RepB/Spo0J family partition protein [Streptomyces sp. NBC_01304]
MPRTKPGSQGGQKPDGQRPTGKGKNDTDRTPFRNMVEGERFMADISQIAPNPRNVREDWEWEEADFEDFVGNVEQHDVLQDPTVIAKAVFVLKFPDDAKHVPENALWVLGMGERRWRAAVRLGKKQLPVVLRNSSADKMDEVLWSENQSRKGLDPIQEAIIFQRFRTEQKLNAEQIAARLGKRGDKALSGSEISKKIKLLQLTDGPARRAVRQRKLGVDPAYQLLNKLRTTKKVEEAWALMEREGIGWQKALEALAPSEKKPSKKSEPQPNFSSTKTGTDIETPKLPAQGGSSDVSNKADAEARRARSIACQHVLSQRTYGEPDELAERLARSILVHAGEPAAQAGMTLLEGAGIPVPEAPLNGTGLARLADAIALASDEFRASSRSSSDWDEHDVRHIKQLVTEAGYAPSPTEAQHIASGAELQQ